MAVITISRQFGAGGRTLGEMLAERFQYRLVDEVLIEHLAQKADVSPEWMRHLEKEAGGSLFRYLSGFSRIRNSYLYKTIIDKKGFIDGHRYVELLQDIIRQIASEDQVVIIGRGGQYILQSHPEAFHLLLVAKRQDRVDFLRRKYELHPLQAEQVIARQDKIRSNLFRYFGKEDYDSPQLYDLVLNMSRMDMDKALNLVYTLMQQQPGSTAQDSASATGSPATASG